MSGYDREDDVQMDKYTMLHKVAEHSDSSLEQTQRFYQAMVEVFSEALGQGEDMDCLPEWGRFIPKLRENPARNESSPRCPKKAHYFIQFKPSPGFEKMLLTMAERKPGQVTKGGNAEWKKKHAGYRFPE